MARCECAKCGDVYTGITAFDMHLRGAGTVHLDPAEVPGLVLKPGGIWGEDRERDDAALARLQKASGTSRGRPQTA